MCIVLNLPLAILKQSMKVYIRFSIWLSGLLIIRRPVSYFLPFKYVYWRASKKSGIYTPWLARVFVAWNTWSQEYRTSNRITHVHSSDHLITRPIPSNDLPTFIVQQSHILVRYIKIFNTFSSSYCRFRYCELSMISMNTFSYAIILAKVYDPNLDLYRTICVNFSWDVPVYT